MFPLATLHKRHGVGRHDSLAGRGEFFSLAKLHERHRKETCKGEEKEQEEMRPGEFIYLFIAKMHDKDSRETCIGGSRRGGCLEGDNRRRMHRRERRREGYIEGGEKRRMHRREERREEEKDALEVIETRREGRCIEGKMKEVKEDA